jgi:hypothetical protein
MEPSPSVRFAYASLGERAPVAVVEREVEREVEVVVVVAVLLAVAVVLCLAAHLPSCRCQ